MKSDLVRETQMPVCGLCGKKYERDEEVEDCLEEHHDDYGLGFICEGVYTLVTFPRPEAIDPDWPGVAKGINGLRKLRRIKRFQLVPYRLDLALRWESRDPSCLLAYVTEFLIITEEE